MRRIAAAQAQPGDVLAEPLVDAEGRRVLPQGARLSAAVLSRFARWGIAEVAIQGDEVDADAGEAPSPAAGDNAALLEALAHRFEGHEDDPAMARIHAVARRHLAALPPGS